MLRNAFRVLFVLWAGSLWSLAGWVALTVFHSLNDAQRAGAIAAQLFSIEFYLGVAVAAWARFMPAPATAAAGGVKSIYGAVLLLAINEFLLKRLMEAARAHGAAAGLSFGAWHGISAVLYVLACLAVLLVAWTQDFRIAGGGRN